VKEFQKSVSIVGNGTMASSLTDQQFFCITLQKRQKTDKTEGKYLPTDS